MPTSHFNRAPASHVEVRLHFDRGYACRPRVFYERLECREWLTCLDWLYAEASERLAALDPESQPEAVEFEHNLLRLLEDEIREAEELHLRLSLSASWKAGSQ
jgi:hypothetical protein